MPIIATDDEHKLSHIQLSIYYYEEWNSSMGRKWYEKYLKDDANTEFGAQRTDQVYPRNHLLKMSSMRLSHFISQIHWSAEKINLI